jgi:hypothetical protein
MSRNPIISSGKRPIHSGKEYDNYFPKPDERDRVIIEDGEVDDTVDLMGKVVWKYLSDTDKIAPLLKKNTLEQTCNAIWDFLYHHVQYRLDKKGLEQLRRPARSWLERTSGVDCDCMSIFASSILTNLQIPHTFRITKYNEDYWQHVYVIVPTKETPKGYFVIDAVISAFNYEKSFSEKSDFPMNLKGINVAVLSGASNDDLYDVLFANHLGSSIMGATNSQNELDQLYQHLVSTRNAIIKNPALISSNEDPQGFLKMIDYAIHYWNTDKRVEALVVLEKNEHLLNTRNGFKSMNGYIIDYDNSLDGISAKGFFSSIKKAVKDVGKGAQVAVKAIVRYNPLSIAARNGFLLAMKLNISKMATHLKWGYATKEQAAKKGITEIQWNKAKDAKAKVEKLFVDKLQGKKEALQKAVLSGKAGNLNGVVENQMHGLGDPVAASSIAAAAPIIKMVIDILKKAGTISPNENIDAEMLAKEVAADPQSAVALKNIEKELEDENKSSVPSDNKNNGKGIIAFIKANPIPTAIGSGLLALGAYQLIKPKQKKTAELNGVKKHTSKKQIHKSKQKRKKGFVEKIQVQRITIQ